MPALVAANPGLTCVTLEHAEGFSARGLARVLDAGPGLDSLMVSGFIGSPGGYRRILDQRTALTCLRCVRARGWECATGFGVCACVRVYVCMCQCPARVCMCVYVCVCPVCVPRPGVATCTSVRESQTKVALWVGVCVRAAHVFRLKHSCEMPPACLARFGPLEPGVCRTPIRELACDLDASGTSALLALVSHTSTYSAASSLRNLVRVRVRVRHLLLNLCGNTLERLHPLATRKLVPTSDVCV